MWILRLMLVIVFVFDYTQKTESNEKLIEIVRPHIAQNMWIDQKKHVKSLIQKPPKIAIMR